MNPKTDTSTTKVESNNLTDFEKLLAGQITSISSLRGHIEQMIEDTYYAARGDRPSLDYMDRIEKAGIVKNMVRLSQVLLRLIPLEHGLLGTSIVNKVEGIRKELASANTAGELDAATVTVLEEYLKRWHKKHKQEEDIVV